MSEKVTIIGAGLAGSLLGLYLARRGYEVEVFEKRWDVRSESAVGKSGGEGRSINLALSVRGLHALEQVGLADVVRQQMIAMKGRMVHPVSGELRLVPYGRNDSEVINSVSRNSLNSILLTALGKEKGVTLHFQKRCVGYDFATSELMMRDEVSGHVSRLKRAPVIGTDGSASALRMSMMGMGRFNFSQGYLEHGYKELTIPPSASGQFQLEPHALHLWPRGGYMMIALPNIDKTFTCTLFFPHAGPVSFASLSTPAAVTGFFKEQFPDAVPLLPKLEEEFFHNPTGSLMTVKCAPWFVGDQVLLLGDAAHAVVPFYGQGMNCSFEDCAIFNEIIAEGGAHWGNWFSKMSEARKVNADAIADLAIDNFFEMRDTSGNPKFALKKQLEHVLEDKYPGKFISKYSMVTFHRVPYSVAMHKGRIQDRVLMEICERASSFAEIEVEKSFAAVQAELAKAG
jgi:kynurenine 3-monooxygenase